MRTQETELMHHSLLISFLIYTCTYTKQSCPQNTITQYCSGIFSHNTNFHLFHMKLKSVNTLTTKILSYEIIKILNFSLYPIRENNLESAKQQMIELSQSVEEHTWMRLWSVSYNGWGPYRGGETWGIPPRIFTTNMKFQQESLVHNMTLARASCHERREHHILN